MVRKHQTVCNARGGVFPIGACDHRTDKIGLRRTEGVARVGVAVRLVRIGLILARIQHDAPQTADTECKVRIAVIGGRKPRHLLGKGTAHIVVAAGEHHGLFTARKRIAEIVNEREVFKIATVIGNITV